MALPAPCSGGYGDPYYRPPPGPYGYPPQPHGMPGYGHPPPAYGYPPPVAHPGHPQPHPHPGCCVAYAPPVHAPPPGYYGAPPAGYPPHHGHPVGPYGFPPVGYPPIGYPGYPPGYPMPRARSRSRSRRASWEGSKYTCRFFIGIPNEAQFRVAKRIIGANGSKMKDIVAKSGGEAKLRLRGQGSGFVERDTNEESTEPLQLCISCPREDGYHIAARMVEDLLTTVYAEYDRWCAEQGKPERAPPIRKTEKHSAGDAAEHAPAKKRAGKTKKQKAAATPSIAPSEDRGEKPPGAPNEEEIQQAIQDRNDARRRSEYEKADQIRDDLKAKGVVLSDEKGGHGTAGSVTNWRYWHD